MQLKTAIVRYCEIVIGHSHCSEFSAIVPHHASLVSQIDKALLSCDSVLSDCHWIVVQLHAIAAHCAASPIGKVCCQRNPLVQVPDTESREHSVLNTKDGKCPASGVCTAATFL